MRISDWSSDVCSSDLRLTPSSARWARVAPAGEPGSPNTLPTLAISSIARLLRLAEAVLPGQRAPRESLDQGIGTLACQREENQRADDDGGTAGHLPIDHQEAETLAGAHQLGGDDEHPAEREAGAQAGRVARQRGRHQDAPHQHDAAEDAAARDLDQLAVGAEEIGRA